ncbi:MAG: chromate transporter [Myxococcota bacterium]
MSSILELAMGWGRVGLVGFGGGPAMIPLMQAECVETNGWVTEEQFLDALAASSALPGPIAAKMSIFVGLEVAGILGAMVAFLGVMLPAVLLMSMLAGVILRYRDAPAVSGAMKAVQPVVIGMLAWTVISLAPTGIRNGSGALLAGAALAALLLKVHPALVIVGAMTIGALFLR